MENLTERRVASMRLSSDQFGDELMKDIEVDRAPSASSRLDQVAEMVADMEKRLNDKIEQANKQVIEHLESSDTPEYTENLSEVKDDILEEKENNDYEDNRVSDPQSEE